MAKGEKHPVICFLATCASSLEKRVFKSSVYLKKRGCFVLLAWKGSLHNLDTKPLSAMSLTQIFSRSVGCLFCAKCFCVPSSKTNPREVGIIHREMKVQREEDGLSVQFLSACTTHACSSTPPCSQR